MGVLTRPDGLVASIASSRFNPLHRGMGVLTLPDHPELAGRRKFQSSTSRHGGTDRGCPARRGRRTKRFNPLHRGMGVLTFVRRTAPRSRPSFNPLHRGMGVLTSGSWLMVSRGVFCFNPLHRGMGVLTYCFDFPVKGSKEFQSSTSRHRGTDQVARRRERRKTSPGFNPLHRGIGVLTAAVDMRLRDLAVVSILYIEA